MKPSRTLIFIGAFKAAINKMTRDMIREFSPQGVRLMLSALALSRQTDAGVGQNNPECPEADKMEVCPSAASPPGRHRLRRRMARVNEADWSPAAPSSSTAAPATWDNQQHKTLFLHCFAPFEIKN